MAKYVLTNKAVDDLSKIWDYTYEIWSENQADKYYFEILSDCQALAENQIYDYITNQPVKDTPTERVLQSVARSDAPIHS